jgi:hypothetical protein
MEEFNDTEEIKEIENDLNVDKNALDFESIDQPRRFFKYAVMSAKVKKESSLLKRQATIKRAECAFDIRSRPAAYGLEKITDNAVFNVVESQDEVRKADEAYEESIYNYNIFEAAKQAFEQRKTTIENLVKLYNQGYWSRPRTESAEAGEAMKEIIAESTTEQERNLNTTMIKRKKL